MELDPIMAKKLHPNDRRKIIRSIEYYYHFGIPHSTLLLKSEANTVKKEL